MSGARLLGLMQEGEGAESATLVRALASSLRILHHSSLGAVSPTRTPTENATVIAELSASSAARSASFLAALGKQHVGACYCWERQGGPHCPQTAADEGSEGEPPRKRQRTEDRTDPSHPPTTSDGPPAPTPLHPLALHGASPTSSTCEEGGGEGTRGGSGCGEGEGGSHLYVVSFCVAADHRRKGIGRLMMSALKERAGACGVGSVRLHVQASNRTARTFYATMGFREAGVQKGFYHHLAAPAPTPAAARPPRRPRSGQRMEGGSADAVLMEWVGRGSVE